MTRLAIVSGLALIAGLGGWLFVPPTSISPPARGSQPDVADNGEPEDPSAAIIRAVPVLEQDGRAWLEGRTAVQDGTGCVSCHQVPFGVWGLQEAARAGIALDEEGMAELTRRAIDFVQQPGVGRTMSWGPLVLASQGQSTATTGFAEFLVASQARDGSWQARGQFPGQRRPLEETNAVATMWTLLALSRVGDTAPAELADADVADSIARAFGWLRETKPGTSTEWLLLATLIEDRWGAFGEAEDGKARKKLLEQQNNDGGWGWLPGEDSNPLSTGQVLYALGVGNSSPGVRSSSEVERAVHYLLDAQSEDGFWRMPSALISRATSSDKDYIYAYWATAWSTIGLARSRPLL